MQLYFISNPVDIGIMVFYVVSLKIPFQLHEK